MTRLRLYLACAALILHWATDSEWCLAWVERLVNDDSDKETL